MSTAPLYHFVHRIYVRGGSHIPENLPIWIFLQSDQHFGNFSVNTMIAIRKLQCV